MFVNHVHLMPPELNEMATLAVYQHLADAVGITGAVCFAPFSYHFKMKGRTDDPNVWLAETIRPHPELVGYGTLNPEKPARPQVEQIADLGFRGIKLHPPAQQFAIIGAWAMEAYEVMQERGLVADFHLGVHWHRLKDYDPLDCDEIAWHFPKLRMVYEHVGGWHYYRQVLAVITNNQRRGNQLYAGIASVLDWENQKYWYLGPEGVNDCRWQIGADRLIYGLDFPYNQLSAIQNDLKIIRSFDWPEADRQALLGGNLRRLIGLDSRG